MQRSNSWKTKRGSGTDDVSPLPQVANLPEEAGYLAIHDGRLFASTWPDQSYTQARRPRLACWLTTRGAPAGGGEDERLLSYDSFGASPVVSF